MTTKKYKTLRRLFPNKKLAKFVAAKGSCKLSLKERWIYSTLLWRFKGHPVSKSRLAKWTGVDRTRTLPKALERLTTVCLVVRVGKKYKSVTPPEDLMSWFATWDNGKGDERLVLAYNWAVYDRSRDIIDNLVACDDALGIHKAAKLARRYGVCAKTITAARRRLKNHLPAVAQGEAAIPTTLQRKFPEQLGVAKKSDSFLQMPVDPARQLAAQYGAHLGLEQKAIIETARLCRSLARLPIRDIGQVVSAFVSKYGVGEGLTDAIFHFILTRRDGYFAYASVERVLSDIGVGCQGDSETEDELSMFGDDDDGRVFQLQLRR